jgi:PAS domain S-box-containing protein
VRNIQQEFSRKACAARVKDADEDSIEFKMSIKDLASWATRGNRPLKTALGAALALWAIVLWSSLSRSASTAIVVCAILGLLLTGYIFFLLSRYEFKYWRARVTELVSWIETGAERGSIDPAPAALYDEFERLIRAIETLEDRRRFRLSARSNLASSNAKATANDSSCRIARALTRSGMYEPPEPADSTFDPFASGAFSTLDMIGRLDPVTLHWIDSSAAEQIFLGWSLADLSRKSFLEVVHPNDRNLAIERFESVVEKGEAHGVRLRIVNSKKETKHVELNIGARYDSNHQITHLRCHWTDVTEKVRSEDEQRKRHKFLQQFNEELKKKNRELAELRDRYGDLYENAPAMYFSLNDEGRIVQCNDTLQRTLGYPREELIDKRVIDLLATDRRGEFETCFADFLRNGYIELETTWRKENGETIVVWVRGTGVFDAKRKLLHSRCVAQDVTARSVLEDELHEKNERLARANDELSRKNKELDEFTHVVSHDLQEPLRTLIAFSDFLLRDSGDKLDENGREYIRFLVEASRRMRSLINDLLALSRAGRVTGEFSEISLAEAARVVIRDLAELIRAKNAEVRILEPLPTIWGDRSRVGQLLGNLISNGLKYNNCDRPVIEIGGRIDTDPGWSVLFVRDNGIGIESQFHGKIFQMFRRLHTREEYEGTGAGLAICQKIVQAHGGRIWVESRPGEGSTFFVALPDQRIAPVVSLRTEVLHVP